VPRIGLANHSNAIVTGEILEDAGCPVAGTIIDDHHQEIDPDATEHLMPGAHHGGNAGGLIIDGHDQSQIVPGASWRFGMSAVVHNSVRFPPHPGGPENRTFRPRACAVAKTCRRPQCRPHVADKAENLGSYLLRIIFSAVTSRAVPKSFFSSAALMAVANLAPIRPPKKKPRQISAATLMSTQPSLW